jgi:hypothetical protein
MGNETAMENVTASKALSNVEETAFEDVTMSLPLPNCAHEGQSQNRKSSKATNRA